MESFGPSRDLPNAAPLEEMRRVLNPGGVGDYEACATVGKGVFETLKAAAKMDKHGNREARDLIAAIKIVAPSMAQRVIDRAMQIHGGMGLTEDLPLAELFNYARQIRLADGPDQVHMMALSGQLIKAWHAGREPA